jgi:hypothetical protein
MSADDKQRQPNERISGSQATHDLAKQVAELDLIQLSHFLASLYRRLHERGKKSELIPEKMMCFTVARNLLGIPD